MFQGVDHGTEAFLRFQAGNIPALDPILRAAAYASHPLILLLLVFLAAGILANQHRPAGSLGLLVAFILGLAVCIGMAYLVGRMRPANAGRYPLLAWPRPSFPSPDVYLAGVAATWLLLAWNTAGAVRPLRLPVNVLIILLPMVVMGSRLVLGLHYLTDVMAGLFLGAGVALVAYQVVCVSGRENLSGAGST